MLIASGFASFYSIGICLYIAPNKSLNVLFILCSIVLFVWGMLTYNTIVKKEYIAFWQEIGNIAGFILAFLVYKKELNNTP
jgi:hypothetical protein